MVRAINSRIPVFRAFYGNGLGDIVQGLFRRIAPKAIPIVKQLGMKAIDVVKEKGIGAARDIASKAFTTVKDRLARLIRRPQTAARSQPVKLPSTEVMPASVSKIINQAANQKLAELADIPMSEKEKNITASLIAGSGLTSRSGITSRSGLRVKRI
jgi:hypothetical protein